MKKMFFLVIVALIFTNAFSFGAFNNFNHRNHAELDWKEIESENIRVIYHDPLQSIAEKTIKISEASYAALSKSYDQSPNHKILIYISDQDDIANGATVFDSYIFIYVNQNEYLQNFSGEDYFIRKVIAHEMSHYFLFNTVADWITSIFKPKPSIAFPKDINEGYAQFFSGEEWGLNRGDKYIKHAVYSNDNLLEKNKTVNGGLLYARGFAIVRYLSEFYGEDSLRELLKYRNKAKVYSFKQAFKKVYKKDYKEFLQEWKQYINTYYYAQAYNHKINAKNDSLFTNTFSDFKKFKHKFKSFREIVIKDSSVIFVTKRNKDQKYYDLAFAKIKADSLKSNKLDFKKIKYLTKGSSFFNLDLSKNGQYGVFTKYSRHEHGSLLPTIYFVNTKSGKVKRLFHGSFPQVNNQGEIFYKKGNLENNLLMHFDGKEHNAIYTFNKEFVFDRISLSPDNSKIALSALSKNGYLVRILDLKTQKIVKDYQFQSFVENLLWLDSKQLITVSGKPNFYRTTYSLLNLEKENKEEYYSPTYNLKPIITKLNANKLEVIGKADIYERKQVFGKIEFSKNKPEIFTKNHYNNWQFISNKYQIETEKFQNIKISEPTKYNSLKELNFRMGAIIPTHKGNLLGGLVSEPLGLHMLYGGIWIPYTSMDDLFYYTTYTNKSFAPTISLNSYRIKMIAGLYDETYYWQSMNIADLSFTLPLDFVKKPFWQQNISLGFSYQKYKATDDETLEYTDNNNKNIYENGEGLIGSANYNLKYNLPYKNSDIHPIKQLDLKLSFSGSTESLNSQNNFYNQTISLQTAYAPLYNLSQGLLQTLTFRNYSYWERQNGDFLNQFSPGIDKEEIFLSGANPFFHRQYLRGYEKTKIGNEIQVTQTEAWLKLSDNMKYSINLKSQIISLSYFGVGSWFDISKYHNKQESETYKAYGYEFKGRINLLGNNFILSYGQAFDFDKKNIGDYFKASVSFKL